MACNKDAFSNKNIHHDIAGSTLSHNRINCCLTKRWLF